MAKSRDLHGRVNGSATQVWTRAPPAPTGCIGREWSRSLPSARRKASGDHLESDPIFAGSGEPGRRVRRWSRAYGAEPTDPGGNGDPNQMTREIKTNPSFTRDIQEIIERGSCNDSACHRPASGEAGLTLSTDLVANYRNLVNVPARSERQFLLVEPGDADNSYLVIRFEDRQSVGALMPIGLPLDSIDLTNFRNWINNGAPEN